MTPLTVMLLHSVAPEVKKISLPVHPFNQRSFQNKVRCLFPTVIEVHNLNNLVVLLST
jgi:hypothetical protein